MQAIESSKPSAQLLLATGDSVDVRGTPDDVARLLQDAVRSSPGTLAWLQAAGGDETVGVNPAHVVMVTGGARSARARGM